METEYINKFARLLVSYSIYAKNQEVISVEGGAAAEPLIAAVYDALLQVGAYPLVRMTPDHAALSFFARAHDHHLDHVPPFEIGLAKALDGSIRIMSSTNTRAMSAVDPAKQTRVAKARRPLRKIMLAKKWALTLFPTEAYAMDAEMSLPDFERFVISANFLDRANPVAEWNKLERMHQKLIARLKGADEIRIVGPDTDLRMSVKKRTFISSVATHNVPSGEIFTGPVEESVEGTIRYDFPVCEGGREIDGIRLVFRGGKVVEASAEKNEKYLLAMLDMDPGARRLGELGIGTNFGIQRFIKNILFDEKIGGTVHLALGESYPETGGVNKSALHWDMIKDLRRGGSLYVDGKLLQKNGRFVA
ncbi:MAG TPA: aminopeptidase [Kiritimatiellia bacterium]|nr:aminopeptidase [Kiritimatiellia bacterium]HMO99018.1 aminopeptidase [Kiritimatiellia bacterium]HMP95905.1 aminopeptidase [Kiritimatiellia bacterium]